VERGQVVLQAGSITPHTKFKAEAYVLTKEKVDVIRHSFRATGHSLFRTTDVTGDMKLPAGVEMVMRETRIGGSDVDHAGSTRKRVAIAIREGGTQSARRRHGDH